MRPAGAWLLSFPFAIAVTLAVFLGPPSSPIHAGTINHASNPAPSESFGGLAGPGIINHPVGVVPAAGIKIPSDWPVSANGAITCMTCHASLPVPGKKAVLRGGQSSLRDDPQAFCAKCHAGGAESRQGAHWQALSRAHITSEYNRESIGDGPSSDSASRVCLGCHDGVNAPDAVSMTRGGEFGGFADRMRNHPIGVTYPMYGKKRSEVPLRPASLVPATINLRGGVVSCLSCHDLYNQEKSLLSVPIEGSQLCFGCHALN